MRVLIDTSGETEEDVWQDDDNEDVLFDFDEFADDVLARLETMEKLLTELVRRLSLPQR